MKVAARWFGARGVVTTLVAVGVTLSGCGESRPSPPGTVSYDRLGVACGEVRRVSDSEVSIDDAMPECGEGYCLHAVDVARGAKQSAGMCSCRCDGEEGTGPFCACSEGFVCREEVRALGLPKSPDAGSYCVPAD